MPHSSESEISCGDTGSDVREAFPSEVWEKAEHLSKRYRVSIDSDPDGGFLGSSQDFQRIFAEGKTPQACFSAAQTLIAVSIATMLANDQRIPEPIGSGKRDRQINFRVSGEEKARMEAARKRRGFEGMGDFVRTAALGVADEILGRP